MDKALILKNLDFGRFPSVREMKIFGLNRFVNLRIYSRRRIQAGSLIRFHAGREGLT